MKVWRFSRPYSHGGIVVAADTAQEAYNTITEYLGHEYYEGCVLREGYFLSIEQPVDGLIYTGDTSKVLFYYPD